MVVENPPHPPEQEANADGEHIQLSITQTKRHANQHHPDQHPLKPTIPLPAPLQTGQRGVVTARYSRMHSEQNTCWQHGKDTGGSDTSRQIALSSRVHEGGGGEQDRRGGEVGDVITLATYLQFQLLIPRAA